MDYYFFFFFQAEDGIRDLYVTGVQTCALPIWFGGRDALAGVPRGGRPNLQRTLPTLSRPETLSSARPAPTQRSRSHGIRHLQDHLPGVAQRLEPVSQFPWQLCRCHSRTNDNCEAVALASAN